MIRSTFHIYAASRSVGRVPPHRSTRLLRLLARLMQVAGLHIQMMLTRASVIVPLFVLGFSRLNESPSARWKQFFNTIVSLGSLSRQILDPISEENLDLTESVVHDTYPIRQPIKALHLVRTAAWPRIAPTTSAAPQSQCQETPQSRQRRVKDAASCIQCTI